jgi:transposase
MTSQAVLETENNAEIVYVAFELSREQWKLGFSDGRKPQIRKVTIKAGDLEACGKEIAKAKQRFGMKESAEVRSCYEAGREGFWLHRALTGMGVRNIVVDAASIEVNRRQRRAKTDRMDVEKLVRQLIPLLEGRTGRLASGASAERRSGG